MIYTIEKANLVSKQLRRFTSGYAHHVAGQFANLDFWMGEVKYAIKIIDEYHQRFDKMRDEQGQWTSSHGAFVYNYCAICGGQCEFSDGKTFSSPPRKVHSDDLKETRKELVDATYFFLARCYRMKLLDKNMLQLKCDEIGTSIDPQDLEK